MYFRSSLRNNPATGQSEGYWRLVESYRNEFVRVCHRTLYNAGFINFDVEIEKAIVKKIVCKKKKTSALDDQELGCYFIKTNLQTENETSLWTIYNFIREIESTFRCLKADLDLRPIYHKNDNATIAHLHLGILTFWLLNTIRYQLKQ